jgi:hypothetical protein
MPKLLPEYRLYIKVLLHFVFFIPIQIYEKLSAGIFANRELIVQCLLK